VHRFQLSEVTDIGTSVLTIFAGADRQSDRVVEVGFRVQEFRAEMCSLLKKPYKKYLYQGGGRRG